MTKEEAAQKTREAVEKAQAVMKEAKAEILSTAWKETPPAETIEKFEPIDQFIRHYLTLAFNPSAYTWLKASPDDAVFVIASSAESSKPGAMISQTEVKRILDKHAGATGPG